MRSIASLLALLLTAQLAAAQDQGTSDQSPDAAPPAAAPPAPAAPSADGPVEYDNPDDKLHELVGLIRQKRMAEFFAAIQEAANLTHPVKNLPREGVLRLGQSLNGLFLDGETVHYVDRVADERHGLSLRRVVYLAYTSRDRWIYFTFILKRGAVGWQFTKFGYTIDRFDLFPEEPQG